ncbi:MAG: hypothetical protein R6W92_14870 [Desulfocurvibacter africanus]
MAQARLFDPYAALAKLRVKLSESPSGEITALFPAYERHNDQQKDLARKIVREHAAVIRLQIARKGESVMKLYAKGLVKVHQGKPVVIDRRNQ